MNLSFVIEMLFNILRGFLRDSRKAAPYAKWLIRIRGYLLILFPKEDYPTFSTNDVALSGVDKKRAAVPVNLVKTEGKKGGFTIPFIKGM